MNEKKRPLGDVLDVLAQLKKVNIPYRLDCMRDNALKVEVVVPGQRWDIEFFSDGEIEIEIFHSDDEISCGKGAVTELQRLFEEFSEGAIS